MKKLFKTLPDPVTVTRDEDILVLRCVFAKP